MRCDVTEEAEESPSSEPERLNSLRVQRARQRTLHAHMCALTYVLGFVLTDGRERGESASPRPMALSVGQSRAVSARSSRVQARSKLVLALPYLARLLLTPLPARCVALPGCM